MLLGHAILYTLIPNPGARAFKCLAVCRGYRDTRSTGLFGEVSHNAVVNDTF